jgi:hypothetical protein
MVGERFLKEMDAPRGIREAKFIGILQLRRILEPIASRDSET